MGNVCCTKTSNQATLESVPTSENISADKPAETPSNVQPIAKTSTIEQE